MLGGGLPRGLPPEGMRAGGTPGSLLLGSLQGRVYIAESIFSALRPVGYSTHLELWAFCPKSGSSDHLSFQMAEKAQGLMSPGQWYGGKEEWNGYQNPGPSVQGPNLPSSVNTFQEKMQTGAGQ